MSLTLHTNFGDIKVELFCHRAPLTSNNFLALAATGYYNETLFHRLIPGFMIQGGDPTRSGNGGDCIYKEYRNSGGFPDEFNDELRHSKRGILSMANSGPDTNRSQFFITFERQLQLDNLYTVFGQIIDGWDVLDRIENVPTHQNSDQPLREVRIDCITIHSNPFADGLIQLPQLVKEES